MESLPWDTEAQGGYPSLPAAVSSASAIRTRASLFTSLLIEELNPLHSKVLLYSRKRSGYGPTITRLAMKLWQTKEGLS
jgi:hypothetical protein